MADNIKEVYWEKIIQAIKETPNDSELAAKIREIYWEIPSYLTK